MTRRVLAAAVGIVAASALVEILLRAALGYHGISEPPIFRYDPELGWTLRPRAHAWQSQLDFGITIDTDDLGLRTYAGRDAREDRPAARRVAVIGDSFAFGWGVDGDAMFSSALERELAGRPQTYAVRTLGVPGYSTDQEHLQWRRLSPSLHVDRVVLLFHESDVSGNLQDSVVMGRVTYFKPRFTLADGRLEPGATPVRDKQEGTPGPLDALKRPMGALATYALAQTAFRRIFPVPEEPATGDRGAGLTDALIAALDEDVRATGASLLIALIPAGPATARTVKRICDAHRIAFLDLESAFHGQTGVELPYDGHWNARGHQIAAHAVAPLIQ